jgi:hypothetical protein
MNQPFASRRRAGYAIILTCTLLGATLTACAPAPAPTGPPAATGMPTPSATLPAATVTTTPVPSVTLPAAAATVTEPPLRQPRPSPTAGATATPAGLPAVHPAGARTGIAQVDAVVDAFLGSSLDARRRLVRFLTTPCTTTRGLGGPPKCASGQADGTPVEVFPYQTGEGGYATRATIEGALTFDVTGLYGVYRVPPPAVRHDYYPAGDYAIVFTRDPGRWSRVTPVLQVIVHVENGAVVALDCTPYVADWPPFEAAAAQWVLPPLE